MLQLSKLLKHLEGHMGTAEPDSTSAPIPWPNKKEDYVLQDSIGIGATATVYKVS